MDSFFGIGIAELFFIAILALIILGPERLPGALREVAKVIRYVRNLTNELTNQFGDEMKVFDDLNPQKIFNEMIEDPEEKKKAAAKAKAAAKPAAKPAAKTTTTTPKPATPKPTTPKPVTAKPAAEKPAADASDATAEAAETPTRVTQLTIKGTLVPSATAAAKTGDDHADETDAPVPTAGEPSILPPAAAAADNAKPDDDGADKKADKVVETPARSTTVAVNGTAASVDGSET